MTMLSLPYLDTPTSTSAAAIFDRNTSRSFDRGVDEREPDAYVCAFPGHYRRPGACIAKSRTPAPAVAQCRRFEVPTALAASSFRNFKSKSGTRIIYLLVPLCFRSSCERVPQCITNFGNGALAAVDRIDPHGRRSLQRVDRAERVAELASGARAEGVAVHWSSLGLSRTTLRNALGSLVETVTTSPTSCRDGKSYVQLGGAEQERATAPHLRANEERHASFGGCRQCWHPHGRRAARACLAEQNLLPSEEPSAGLRLRRNRWRKNAARQASRISWAACSPHEWAPERTP